MTRDPLTITHITDASASGVLAAVTALAKAQSELEMVDVEFLYCPRPDSPSIDRIRDMLGPDVRVRRLTTKPRLAVPALAACLPRVLARRHGVVHLHSSRAGLIGRLLAPVLGARRRTVYSPHCFAFDRTGITRWHRALLVLAERIGVRAAPALIAVSAGEEQLAHDAVAATRTAVLRNRIDPARIDEARKALGADACDSEGGSSGSQKRLPLRVVHVGRIAAQKRPDEFAAIAAWCAAEHPDIPVGFRWVGDGDRSLLGETATSGNVTVTGWVTGTDVLRELSRADLMLFTSAGEGLPMAVLEAQAMGVPVIAHDVTGLADVIENGTTGVLCTHRAEMQDALASLLRDAAARRALSRNAIAAIARSDTAAALARESLEVYRQVGVLGAHGPGRDTVRPADGTEGER